VSPDVNPELVAAVSAILVALVRELLRWHEHRLRQRGELHTRADDGADVDGRDSAG
jgi:hypothetical protein